MSLKLHKNITVNERKARSVRMLEAVGLGQRVNYYSDNLSGGQKQRVAMSDDKPLRVYARALVSYELVQFCT